MKFALITFINGGLLTITASYKNTAKLYNLSSKFESVRNSPDYRNWVASYNQDEKDYTRNKQYIVDNYVVTEDIMSITKSDHIDTNNIILITC